MDVIGFVGGVVVGVGFVGCVVVDVGSVTLVVEDVCFTAGLVVDVDGVADGVVEDDNCGVSAVLKSAIDVTPSVSPLDITESHSWSYPLAIERI